MGRGKKTSKGQEKIPPFNSFLLYSDSSVIYCFSGSIHMLAHAMALMQLAVGTTSHRRLRYGCFSSVSTIQGRLAKKTVSGGSAAKEALLLQKRDWQWLAGPSRSSILWELPLGCQGGAGGRGRPFCPKKTSSAGVAVLVQGEDPSNPLLKVFNLAPEWSPNPNQPWDQTLSCYAADFFLYFNMSGSSEVCGVSIQFYGPANASNHSRRIQRQQGYL